EEDGHRGGRAGRRGLAGRVRAGGELLRRRAGVQRVRAVDAPLAHEHPHQHGAPPAVPGALLGGISLPAGQPEHVAAGSDRGVPV
ncbi:MAG: hypothetical protein AVDCRST_MAG68-3237, partial [uncultured Gemmatimonadetes bacterium]